MDRLVSIDHLSGTAVLKLSPEDEEEATNKERKSQRNTGHECSGNIVEIAAGGVQEVTRECSGQGSGSKVGLIDLPTCHHTEVKCRWMLEMAETYKNFIPSSLSGLPSIFLP